jgi:hypothetical protein
MLAATSACASRAPAAGRAALTSASEGDRGDNSGACVVECGPVTATVAPALVDHHAAAVADADAVFAAMQPDLLACYRAEWRHFDVLVEMLGDAGLACITRRVKRAMFAPVWGGGTLQLSVPVFFRPSGVDDTI